MFVAVRRRSRPGIADALLVVSIALVASCSITRAPGGSSETVVSETRSTGVFRSLKIGNGITADVAVGGPQAIVIDARAAVLPQVETTVVDGELIVAIRGSVETSDPVHASIALPTLESVEAETSAHVSLTGFAGRSLHLVASGSASITGTGSVTDLAISATSSADVQLRALEAETVAVDVGTSARADVSARSAVTGAVHESGTVTVFGRPRRVDVRASTSGRVETP
jgi:hypothetical protein